MSTALFPRLSIHYTVHLFGFVRYLDNFFCSALYALYYGMPTGKLLKSLTEDWWWVSTFSAIPREEILLLSRYFR